MLWNRTFFILTAAILAAFAAGFLFDLKWSTWIWPFYSYRMSQIFIASILLAIAAPVILIGITREWAAAQGGAINLGVMFAIMAIYALASGGSRAVTVFGWGAAISAAIQAGLYILARRQEFRDRRPIPRLVIWSFGVYIFLLLAVGGALVLKVRNILPWTVSGDVSVMYGAIFLGAACYFIFAIAVGFWGAAQGPLLGFLVYDIVLIGPFTAQFSTVPDRFKASLTVYTAVVVYSGVLAAFYLLRGPGTAPQQTQPD